jgi:rod shape-determining protein MreC
MFQVALATPAADLDRSTDVLLLHDQAEPKGPPDLPVPAGPSPALAPAASASVAAPAVRPGPTGGVPR